MDGQLVKRGVKKSYTSALVLALLAARGDALGGGWQEISFGTALAAFCPCSVPLTVVWELKSPLVLNVLLL